MVMWQLGAVLGTLLFGHSCAQDVGSRKGLFVLKGPFRPGGSMPDWNIGGSTVVTDNYIRLTPAEAAHAGSIWSKERVPFREWDIDIQFKVSGARYLGGDGFAVWVTEQSEEFGGTFGNKDEFKGLGIIFDTYDNDGQRDNPSISAISSDGTMRFNHDSDGAGQKIPNAHCNLNYRNPRTPVSVKIRYQENVLTVSHDIHGKEEYVECFRTGVLILPTEYFIGVTAHTGQVADNHDIFFLRVTDIGNDPEPAALPTNSQQERSQPPPIDSVVSNSGGHVPNESVEEQHKWKEGDDRHLMRFADSVVNWAAKSPAEKEQLALQRRKDFEKKRASNADESTATGSGAASPLQSGPEGAQTGSESISLEANAAEDSIRKALDEEKRVVFDAVSDQRHFRDEVSSTLAIIQAEVKAIAHEMRGTITLAHAVPQASIVDNNGDDDNGDSSGSRQGGGSMSELLASISDVVRTAQKTATDDAAARAEGLRLQLDALQRDQASLLSGVKAAAVLHPVHHENKERLQELNSNMVKVQTALADLKRRQELAAEQRQVPPTAATTTAGGGGGVSWIVFSLSHMPWIGLLVYQRFASGAGSGGSGGSGRQDSFYPPRAANKNV